MHPDPVLGADVGDRLERVDGARERRSRCGDHGDGCAAGCTIGANQLIEGRGAHAAVLINGHGAEVVGPDAEQLDRAHDRVVGIR